MTVDDFIVRFRVAVNDVSDPPMWARAEIVGFLNEGVQEACERAKLIEDRLTPSVCSIDIQPGESSYALHASVFEIKRMTLRGYPLTESSIEKLDAECPGWERIAGTPRWFVFEQASGKRAPRVRLVPTPSRADALALTVYRGALRELDSDERFGQDQPDIAPRFHPRLMDWVLHRAYLKQDSELFNPAKAAESLALFVHAFGERPDANVQRKQRDRRPPIVRMSNW